MTTDAIEEVGMQLRCAISYVGIFGTLPDGDAASKKAALRKQFAYLARLVHPDHAPREREQKAGEVFDLLNRMRQAAEAAIESNTYDESFKSRTVSMNVSAAEEFDTEIQSVSGSYRLAKDPFRHGDFSVLYRGKIVGSDDTNILAKIARDPTSNSWLEKEAVLLKELKDAKAGSPLLGIGKFMPNLLDTFLVSGEKNTRYRTNVYTYVPGMVSITDIMAAYPKGLEAPQAVWVARRVFAQTLAAAMMGVVQSITPDHVLVEPFTHEPLHLGWPHAVNVGERITHVIDRWKDCYPPEVFEKKTVDHRTDIYIAGATIVKLMGGSVGCKSLPASVPKEVAQIILRCLADSPARRPQDGRQLLDEFTRVIRSQWRRMYRPLTMPIQ